MRSKRFVYIGVSQVVAIICAMISFYFWAPWMSALSSGEAAKKYPGETIPASRAVVVEHGNIIAWRLGTPSQNPLGFSLCTVVLFSAVIYLVASAYYIKRQRKDEKPGS